MRASTEGRDEFSGSVQHALSLPTKKRLSTSSMRDRELGNHPAHHLGTDGFTLKLSGFGKFYVRHKPGIRRKIGYTGETIQTKMRRKVKFISLGPLRQRERAD